MIFDIMQVGDPVLRQASRPLAAAEIGTPFVQELVSLMRLTMHAASGVGLAAPQVGEGLQVVVMEDVRRLSQPQVALGSRPAVERRGGARRGGDRGARRLVAALAYHEQMSDAGSIVCGREITTDTILDADLVCDRGPALVVVADGVTLDLGGHTVSGDPDGRDRGPGILLRGVSKVTVRNGTVQHFDAGVALEGGAGNVVEGLIVQDNIGPHDGDYGDGIVVSESSNNTVRGNTVRRNGPFSGISLGRSAAGNEVAENTVTDHDMSQLGFPDAGRQTMGIRIEGPAANHNRIVGNTVTGSGCDGIVVLAACDNPGDEPPCVGSPPNEHNEIAHNTSNRNGRSGRGCGIRLFSMPLPMPPIHNIVRDNTTDDNASYGIALDGLPLRSPGNQALRNRAHGNGEFDGSDGTLMPPCGKNVWAGNDFGTANQPCVERPEES